MINEEKLLCAFIYSAYDSGYCGNNLGQETKSNHMNLYRDFIKEEKYFPKKEIDESQKKMMDEVNSTSTRGYVYGDHTEVVIKRIETETNQNLEEALGNKMYLEAAFSCPTNFYEVVETREGEIIGQSLVLPKMKKKLTVLEGLEKPRVGDKVSGHWDYFLEILPEEEIQKYIGQSKNHIERLAKNAKQ